MTKRQRTTNTATIDDASKGKTDWKKIDALTDRQIVEAIENDPDAAPALEEAWFENAELVMPIAKDRITMRLDQDVLSWFKKQGRGYQTRINAVLRTYMEAKK
jgi:uncharacterized protein (DUF4415 family)